jgi:RNA polymerase sigma-70 factor (ECF subfamily)
VVRPTEQRIEPVPDTHVTTLRVTPRQAFEDATPSAAPVRANLDFDALYAEHFPFVWRCLMGHGVAESALDDAAQEVFLVVHRRLAGFRGESAIRTWLYGIVRNVATNHRRSVRRRATAPLDERLPSAKPGPDANAEDAEAAAFVARFVAALDDKKRDVFVLALVEELAVPEVAEMLGIPLNTAYTRLRAVRAEFRRALELRGGAR